MKISFRFTLPILAATILICLFTAPVFAGKVESPEIQGVYLLYETDRIILRFVDQFQLPT